MWWETPGIQNTGLYILKGRALFGVKWESTEDSDIAKDTIIFVYQIYPPRLLWYGNGMGIKYNEPTGYSEHATSLLGIIFS